MGEGGDRAVHGSEQWSNSWRRDVEFREGFCFILLFNKDILHHEYIPMRMIL